MISIIVSSYNVDYFASFENNVRKTIGVEFEIVQVWNPGLFSISEAYNKGAREAIYPFLVFCHEDLSFNTVNWGLTLVECFQQDSSVGAIGLAGAGYVPFFFGGWGTYLSGYEKLYLIQHYKFVKHDPVFLNVGNNGTCKEDVCGLDGYFIATTKRIWSDIKFDEINFKKFHFYDLDFSLRISEKYKVKVLYNIETEHFSEGRYDKEWLEEFSVFNKKWVKKLPISIDNRIVPSIDKYGEYRYLCLVVKERNSLLDYYKYIMSNEYYQIVGRWSLIKILLKFPYRYLRLRFIVYS